MCGVDWVESVEGMESEWLWIDTEADENIKDIKKRE